MNPRGAVYGARKRSLFIPERKVVAGLSRIGSGYALAALLRLAALSLFLVASGAQAETAPASEIRSELTAADLLADHYVGEAPVNNTSFMPVGRHGPARHRFEGTLGLPEFAFRVAYAATLLEPSDLPPGQALFPAVDLQFFMEGDNLVPVRRGIIRARGGDSPYAIIVSPGKVWSEAGDEGFSRASFPFVLVNSIANDARNGIGTFLFDDGRVSSFRFQIVQESAPWAMLDMWGQSPMSYRPRAIEGRAALAAQFVAERAHEAPLRPWSALAAVAEGNPVAAITHRGGLVESVSVAGLIVDNVIYAYPCHARYGDYPYCRQMRHGVYSVTKSMGAALTLLRLARKYGPRVFDLKIKDYVDIEVAHDGWEQVTFAHALSMATGIGYGSRAREPLDIESNEDTPTFLDWLALPSAREKLLMAFRVGGNYPWGPGEVARYDTMQSFILAAAMDGFLKKMEDPDADLWDMMQKEVLEPIGAFHVPMMRTVESDGARGLPIMGYGLYLSIDDIAKIARLLQDGGRHDGRQLLHAGKLAEALYRTERRGLPTGGIGRDHDYYLSFWMKPFDDGRGCETWLPKMVGYGGNIVMLLPNGITAFRLADNHQYDARDLALAANDVRPLCPL